jgi:TonB-dependent receptor
LHIQAYGGFMLFKKKIAAILFLIFILISSVPSLYAQGNSGIEGFILDAFSGETLPGANVYLDGTSFGSSSNIEGKYAITKIPAGSYTLHIRYIGYVDLDVAIQLKEGETLTKHFELHPAALEGETIVVTAQALGQQAAINQQLSANSIKNIVSSKQIQSLPDANAAESLRRLPGVAITRDGGEGNKVVIRGMDPKFNTITIDGVRMASSNRYDRGTDLSMISSTMLEGIEVSKTLTADQDADVIGGSVNFEIKDAKGGQKEGLAFNILAQNGFSALANTGNYNNYKITPSVEGRFFNEKLGVFLQANFERRNLTSNEFNSQYSALLFESDPNSKYKTDALFVHNIPRDRTRSNGALVFDYKLEEGSIKLANFLSSSTTKKEDRNEIFNVRLGPQANNQHIYNLSYSKSTVNLIHNSLNIEKQLPFVHTNLKLSHSYSETDNPNDWTVSFFQVPANLSQFEEKENLDPKTVINAVLNDADKTRLNTIQTNKNFTKERSFIAALDFDFPLNFTKSVTSVIKFGGKYKTQDRSFKAEVFGTNATITSPSAREGAQLIAGHFGWTGDPNAIPLSLFIDNDYDYGDIFSGDYKMNNPMDAGKVAELVKFIQNNVDEFTGNSPEAFARNNYLSNTNNYSGKEIVSAAYAMATINIGQQLTIIPGIRFQELQTTYSGAQGQQTTFSYNFYNHLDTSVTRIHPFWLPNLNIQYKPLDWFDIRLAYSNSVSYPDFNAIIPRIDAYGSPFIEWNNSALKPIESENYDIYLSFSENYVGLLTIGGFYKNVKNLIYPWTFNVRGRDAQPYYLSDKKPNPRSRYNISTFVNNPFLAKTWGVELDWQTHFWYLSDPFKGLILNVNYTHSGSEVKYPFQTASNGGYTALDTSFTDRLIFQPNDILNLTIGYDYKDFSVKLSFQYTDDVFAFVSQNIQQRGNTAPYKRWDLAIKQTLPWYALQLYANLNNLNGAQDKSVLQLYPNIPKTIEEYGMTAELGLRWQL